MVLEMKNKLTKKRVYRPKPNWLGWIKWVNLVDDFNIVCCDCGLVHRYQFRVTSKNKVQWRSKRNKEETKLFRSSTPKKTKK